MYKAILISLFFILLPRVCLAAGDSGSIDNIIDIYKDATQQWEPVILGLTKGLFWLLVTISFTWSSIQLLLRDAGLVDLIADLTRRVLTIGVCIWLLVEAPNLARAFISSFQKIGSTLSGGVVGFSPSNVVELAINIILMCFKQASLFEPVASIMIFLIAIIILICFSLIAYEMTTLIVTAYITISGGVVMMGFLGSEWTRENALNYFTAILGVAVRMFVMQLIFILGYGFVQTMTNAMNIESSNGDYVLLAIVAIIFYGLIREIPQMAASLASGRFTMAGGGIHAGVGAVAGLAAGAALATTGVGAAAVAGVSSSMSKEDTATNEASTLKRSLDTGGNTASKPSYNTSSKSSVPSDLFSSAFSSTESPTVSGRTSNSDGAIVKPSRAAATNNTVQRSESESGSSASSPETPRVENEGGDVEKQSSEESAPKSPVTPSTSSSPSIPPTMSQRVMRATGEGIKAAAKASGSIAKNVAVSSLHSVAQQSTVGKALSRTGFDLMKLDTKDPKQTKAAHSALMKEFNMSKDDGNDRNNYRATLEASDERHKRFKDKSDK